MWKWKSFFRPRISWVFHSYVGGFGNKKDLVSFSTLTPLSEKFLNRFSDVYFLLPLIFFSPVIFSLPVHFPTVPPHPTPPHPDRPSLLSGFSSLMRVRCVFFYWDQTSQSSAVYVLGALYQLMYAAWLVAQNLRDLRGFGYLRLLFYLWGCPPPQLLPAIP